MQQVSYQPSKHQVNMTPKRDPYMSTIRMKNRMNQPITIFNEHLVSEKMTQSRWAHH